mmetsp:Transcript_49529/g.152852  ORF Transcript_49529/g.152852 Transcript_49529/m.152852 type:complete len:300 (+) Transcript_49529:431-1330(+)
MPGVRSAPSLGRQHRTRGGRPAAVGPHRGAHRERVPPSRPPAARQRDGAEIDLRRHVRRGVRHARGGLARGRPRRRHHLRHREHRDALARKEEAALRQRQRRAVRAVPPQSAAPGVQPRPRVQIRVGRGEAAAEPLSALPAAASERVRRGHRRREHRSGRDLGARHARGDEVLRHRRHDEARRRCPVQARALPLLDQLHPGGQVQHVLRHRVPLQRQPWDEGAAARFVQAAAEPRLEAARVSPIHGHGRGCPPRHPRRRRVAPHGLRRHQGHSAQVSELTAPLRWIPFRGGRGQGDARL